ncbi:MAG: hypothetical protein ACK46X_09225 [Candidatus Sericytochromatia bacterium]
MGNELTKLAKSTWATVATATGAIALKQVVVDGQPIEIASALLGAGLVIGYLDWRRRQGDPGLTPERLAQTGPAPGGVARVPVIATIVVGTFCLLHAFLAFLVLCLYFALTHSRVKAANGGEEAPPSLSQVLGDLLIFDAGSRDADPAMPPLPTPKPLVREVSSRVPKPAPELTWATTPEHLAEPPAAMEAEAAVAPAAAFSLAPMSGPLLFTPSSLGTSVPLTLESRLPSTFESQFSSLSDSLGLSSGGPNGFDEALALLQGKPASADHPD